MSSNDPSMDEREVAFSAAKHVHDLMSRYLQPLGPEAVVNDLPAEQRAEVLAAINDAYTIQELTGVDTGLRR